MPGSLIFCHAINTTGVIIHAPVIASRANDNATQQNRRIVISATALVAIHLN